MHQLSDIVGVVVIVMALGADGGRRWLGIDDT